MWKDDDYELTPLDHLIDAFVEMLPESDFSFAHIVLSDHNTTPEFCEAAMQPERMKDWSDQLIKDGHDPKEIETMGETIKQFLLLMIRLQTMHGVE